MGRRDWLAIALGLRSRSARGGTMGYEHPMPETTDNSGLYTGVVKHKVLE